jgi:quercetin dioxygenase-like cupin family protein
MTAPNMEGGGMIAAKLDELELMDGWAENDPEMRMWVDFPIFAATGTKSSAVVYFETKPGHHIGRHTDSAEEVLLILEGTAEATVGDERGRLSTGELALVLEMVPHDVYNVGDKTLKVLGFFSAAEVVSTFDEPVMPEGRRVVGTPPPETFEASDS